MIITVKYEKCMKVFGQISDFPGYIIVCTFASRKPLVDFYFDAK